MNFGQGDSLRVLFSDEKLFDIDVVCNAQNKRIWTPSRPEAHAKRSIKEVQEFQEEVMI